MPQHNISSSQTSQQEFIRTTHILLHVRIEIPRNNQFVELIATNKHYFNKLISY